MGGMSKRGGGGGGGGVDGREKMKREKERKKMWQWKQVHIVKRSRRSNVEGCLVRGLGVDVFEFRV